MKFDHVFLLLSRLCRTANSMSSSASDRPQYPRTQYNIQRPPHISTMDPSLSQQNIQGSIIHSPENPYAYDVVPANYRYALHSHTHIHVCEYFERNEYFLIFGYHSNPNMAFPGGVPVDMSKHRGHPLKSFSIPAPPSNSNTPLIPGQKGERLLPSNCPPNEG